MTLGIDCQSNIGRGSISSYSRWVQAVNAWYSKRLLAALIGLLFDWFLGSSEYGGPCCRDKCIGGDLAFEVAQRTASEF
jgi:hypothetical protein